MAGMIMPAVRMMPLSGNNIVSWFGRIVVTYYHLCFKKDLKGGGVLKELKEIIYDGSDCTTAWWIVISFVRCMRYETC